MYAQKKRSPNLLAVAAVALVALLILAIAGAIIVAVLLFGVNRAEVTVGEMDRERQPALVVDDDTTQGEAPIEIPPAPPTTVPVGGSIDG